MGRGVQALPYRSDMAVQPSMTTSMSSTEAPLAMLIPPPYMALPPRSVRTFTFPLPTKPMAMVEEEVVVEVEGGA